MKIATALLLTAIAVRATAGEVAAAPVERCVACHGADGIGLDPQWPNLAGQQRGYLAKQLRAYRAGARSNDMMLPLVLDLSDAEIDALAAHYAGLPRSQP